MKVFIGARTHPGQRPNNEDCHAVVDVRSAGINADGLIVVADGMGGRSFGEAASASAVETVTETLGELMQVERGDSVPVTDALSAALRKANSRVFAMAQEDPTRHGMGTTCVIAVVSGRRLNLAHVGDSRAYLLGDDGLEQLTDDHSFVADQVRAGNITEDSARNSRFKNVITRAVGIEPTIAPDLDLYDLSNAQSLLICTDGLTNALDDHEITNRLREAPTAQAAADSLVDAAVANGGRDNITVVVARFNTDAPGTAAPKATQKLSPSMSNGFKQVAKVTEPGESDKPSKHGGSAKRSPQARSRLLLSALTACMLIAMTVAAYFGSVLVSKGFVFKASRPFVAPRTVPPAVAPNLSTLVYDNPAVFFYLPIRNDVLAEGADGTLVVVTAKGHVMALDASGKATAYPETKTFQSMLEPALTSAGQSFGRDVQGNLYVTNRKLMSITKIDRNGIVLGQIALKKLVNPGAVAVAADGTLYVVDGQYLKVIHGRPR